jgi:iron(III) transport system ATP-binding protein
MTSVVVEGLSKSFGNRLVLAGVDLEVPEGSLTAVLGPSGSGKTTLLRIIAGFERPSAGSVTLGGAVVEAGRCHVPPEARRIGYVPQEGALFPHLDARANVAFGLPRRERRGPRAEALLALVGLAGQGHLYPHQLSGGQQQRVALARALAIQPRLVLMDEPFSSLDPALRSEVRADVVRVLTRTGTTAVLVTHDQDEALSVADRVAVLRDGRVAQCAAPEELYYRPLDPALARFVGDANILPGRTRHGMVETAIGLLAVGTGPGGAGAGRAGAGGAGAGGGASDGQEVMVLVRPEQLHLEPDGRGPVGRVAECRFYGHDTLVTVEVGPDGAGMALQVRLPGRTDGPGGGRPLQAGSPVGLSVSGPVMAWPA